MTWFLAIIYDYSLLFLGITVVGDLRNSVSGSRKDSAASEVLEVKTYNNEDPLGLQSSDHLGMVLVSIPLTGNNYLSWNHSMKIALGAKVKLGFINGKCKMLDEDSLDFEQWNKVDCRVISWILNSISKEIIEDFLHTTSARELWKELEERFGESNGLLLYQVQRELSFISQGSMYVVQYYTKLKKLWDELTCLMPIPQCTYGVAKSVA